MKIIRKGTPPTDRYYQGTCHTCMSVVEFQEKEECVTRVKDARDGDYFSVECPVCKEAGITPVSKINASVYNPVVKDRTV